MTALLLCTAGLLQNMLKHFPSPPEAVLATCLPCVLAILDGQAQLPLPAATSSPAGTSTQSTATVDSNTLSPHGGAARLCWPEAAELAVQQDPEVHVHRHLYSLQRHFQAGVDEELPSNERLLTPEADRAVERAARFVLWDLCYTPQRATSWGHVPCGCSCLWHAETHSVLAKFG